MCYLFSDKFNNIQFAAALSEDLGFNTLNEFLAYIDPYNSEVKQRGRPIVAKDVQQKIHDHWLANSEFSTDPHALYEGIKKNIGGLPHSLTDYPTNQFTCSEDSNISYPKLKYINGQCQNKCKIVNKLINTTW